MILTRQQLEEREQKTLASYAVKSAESRGRTYPESEDPYRTVFQRDRDRIIHSKAFRRMRGKTQVFVAHYGDHYRTRLAHSMEVAQLSRDISRTLNLNEDLADTIALAHDLGHTPFGHAGQDEMNEIMKQYGEHFEHNEQSRRVVELLEDKKPDYAGLNLSFEVRDGLMKHRTTFDQPGLDTLMPSIEAQIVNRADEIAYMNHDIDDGLRSGILKFEDFYGLRLWEKAKTRIDSSLGLEHRIMALISALISTMVDDLVANTDRLIREHDFKSVDDVNSVKDEIGRFSTEILSHTDELKAFLLKRFYLSDGVAEYNQKGKDVIRFLFEKLYARPRLLPTAHQPSNNDPLCIVVKDYIAGMTDNFALDLYNELQ